MARQRASSASASAALLLTHIRQLLTLRGDEGPRRGPELQELGIIEDAAVLCAGGKIVAVGTTAEASRDHWLRMHKNSVEEVDCSHAVVLPGFLDAHTHPVFAAPRLADFEKRISGASYEEIATAGGGIRSSAAAVREAGKTELSARVLETFRQMAAQGTTTVEAKSGYGLSVEAELKSLEAIALAARHFPGTVVPTLLGAHAIPPEFADDRDEWVRLVCEELIPQADDANLAWFVDVFCDRDAFTAEEAELILTAAWQRGLGARLHANQISSVSLHGLLKFNPASLDHMDYVGDEDIAAIAQTSTVVTLLPASNYFLGLDKLPPARKLIDAGVAVGLATDFNPGTAPTPSIPLVLSLACTQMRLAPAEAITAATINAAHSLRLAESKGSVEPGKDADLAIFDVDDYREIPYWFGVSRCSAVVIGGTRYSSSKFQRPKEKF